MINWRTTLDGGENLWNIDSFLYAHSHKITLPSAWTYFFPLFLFEIHTKPYPNGDQQGILSLCSAKSLQYRHLVYQLADLHSEKKPTWCGNIHAGAHHRLIHPSPVNGLPHCFGRRSNSLSIRVASCAFQWALCLRYHAGLWYGQTPRKAETIQHDDDTLCCHVDAPPVYSKSGHRC